MARYCCPFCNKYSWQPDFTDAMFKWAWDICESVGWNRTYAAELLGVSHRTLKNWIIKWEAAGYVIPKSDRKLWRKPKYARKVR